jgi:hypothetical protein
VACGHRVIFGCPHTTGSSPVAALVRSPAPSLTSKVTISGWSIRPRARSRASASTRRVRMMRARSTRPAAIIGQHPPLLELRLRPAGTLAAGSPFGLAAVRAPDPLVGQPLGAFGAGDCGHPPLGGEPAFGVEFDHGAVA